MPIEFHERVLTNGLRVIAETDPAAHTAAAGFFVRTGARDEASEVMGVSHFLEHMMFKGTADITADQLNQRFDRMGARNNAYTSSELTCFYAHVLPERAIDAVELLGAMMRPALRQDDFDTEKGVILEEIAMYKDNPFWVLYEACLERHYEHHPLGHRVLGTNETITNLTSDAMRAYFDGRYSADNTAVALAGRIDFDACCASIERVCADWGSTGAVRDPATPSIQDRVVTLRDPGVSRGYAILVAPGPAASDDRRYAAAMLSQVLGAPDNSRLHWSLIETGLAEEAQASFDAHDGVGEFFVYASGDPERLPEILGVIDRELDGLVSSLTEDDLVCLRARLATAVTLGGERPADRMQRLGRQWTLRRPYTTLEDELARIERVTLDEMRAVHEAFPFRPRTLATLTPAES